MLRTLSHPGRLGLLISGWICLILAIIGIVLPLLPTTPFVLLSAFCFSKSSPRTYHWLVNQPRLGPMIQNWERYGTINKGAKITATVLMSSLFCVSLLMIPMGFLLQSVLLVVGAGVLSYIWTRPSLPHLKEIPRQACAE